MQSAAQPLPLSSCFSDTEFLRHNLGVNTASRTSLRHQEPPYLISPATDNAFETNLLSSKRDKGNPCDPVDAVVFFFRRLTDPENLHRFTTQVSVPIFRSSGGGLSVCLFAAVSLPGRTNTRHMQSMPYASASHVRCSEHEPQWELCA